MKVKCRIGNSSMVLEVTQNFVLKDIAVTHFKSKSINVDLDEYCFKIPNYDFFLDLDQTINDLLEVAWVFQDKEQEDVVATILLIRKAEKGDSIQRETLTIDPAQEASLCVWAFKRGGSTGGILSGFKKRYFILQSNTLYYSESPGSSVLGYIPMAGIQSKIRTDIQYKEKIAFELTTTSSNSRSYVLCADQLEFSQLHQALDELQLRRVKSTCVTLCQELIRRDVSQMQGLFRLSGEKGQVESLKHQYDLALDPDLTDYPSEVLSGVVKSCLRSLESPIIGFGLYNEYLRFGKLQPGPERTEAIITAIKRLPPSTRAFLHYLCSMLKFVSTHSNTNLMNTKNLAIVIGPNLLRPQRESTQSAMNDNQYVLAATQALIDEVDVVFGPSLVISLPDTPASTEAVNTRRQSLFQQTGYGQNVTGKAPPQHQSRQSRYSISEIDPSLAFVQDLKGAMKSSKTVGIKIQQLNDKHAQVMQKWDDLIRAIKTNPHSTMNMSEFILNQSALDERWVDQGLQSLDQVFANLSELVELLTPEATDPTTPQHQQPPTSPTHQQHQPPPHPQHPQHPPNQPPLPPIPTQQQQQQQQHTAPPPLVTDFPVSPRTRETVSVHPSSNQSHNIPSPPTTVNHNRNGSTYNNTSSGNYPPPSPVSGLPPNKPIPPPPNKPLPPPTPTNHNNAARISEDSTDVPPPPPPDSD